MGTHPIFESDFDCLTDLKSKWTARVVNQDVTLEFLSDEKISKKKPKISPSAITSSNQAINK